MAGCDKVLTENPRISSKHCKLVREGETIYLVDTSTNGTVVNGARVAKDSKVVC